jgi:hypothetical protein
MVSLLLGVPIEPVVGFMKKLWGHAQVHLRVPQMNMTEIDRQVMKESLHISTLLVPGSEAVNGGRMAQVVNTRLLAYIRSADTGMIAQDTESVLERIWLDLLPRRRGEKWSVGWLPRRQSKGTLSQNLSQLRSHGDQSRLAELCIPYRQDRLIQVYVGASQICCFPQTQGSPVERQNHRADGHCSQKGTPRIEFDHLKKTADLFRRVDVGRESWRALWHYHRKRHFGNVIATQGVSKEAPQTAQLGEPRLGDWPGFTQESIDMPKLNTRNAGSRTDGSAKSPKYRRIRYEW